MKKLFYLGNILSEHGYNKTTIETLGASLEKEGFKIKYSSNKKNQIVRLLDMIFTTLLNTKKVDFILIDTYSTSSFWYVFLCSQIARVFKVKYIPILHGGNLPQRLQQNPTFSKMIFKYAYRNVAPSNYLKHEFEKVGYTNVIYIPNTIELEKYTFVNRECFEPNLLWVRAFAAIYNPNMAIYVLKEVQKTYPNATLTMVGPDKDGSLREAKELAKKLCVDVNFTGQLTKEEWWGLATQHDIFLNTTHFDNTPISVLEAMALGLAVVSTNVGGIPYLIHDKKEALLVEDRDVIAMSKAVVGILTNNEMAFKRIQNARLLVEGFDWLVVRSKWLYLLHK